MKETNLYSLLHGVSRVTLALELLRAALGGLGLFVAAVLAVMTVDAVLSLQPWGLIAVDALLVLLVGALAYYTGLQAYRNLFYPRRAARLIEQKLGLQDNRLINAVDLAEAPANSASPELIRKTVGEGETLAAELDIFQCVNFPRIYRPAAAAAAVLTFAVVSYCLAPHAFGMVLPRLLDPTGDHPPYTLLQFAVKIEPEPIYHGRGANITVDLSGPQIPSQADIVMVRDGVKQRSAMFRRGENSFVLPIERAEASCQFYIDTPDGRSRRYPLNVLSVPLFEKVEVAYAYPDYTKWAGHQHALDARGIQGLAGTKVTLKVKSNIPLRAGRLELIHLKPDDDKPVATSEITLKADSTDVAIVAATFPLEFSGRFKLSLTGTNGAESLDKIEGQLLAMEDRAPRVAILEPAPHLIVVENWKVPVIVQASDDVAVRRIRLYRSVNGWGPDPIDLTLTAKQPTVAVGHYEFDLGKLGARAGDVIQYFASASDNHPPNGQSSDSETHVIQVISEEEYTEFARRDYQLSALENELQKYQRQMEKLQAEREKLQQPLEELKKKLESKEKLTKEEQEQLQKLLEQAQQYQKQAEELAQSMHDRAAQKQLYDLEQPYQEMLEKLAKQLDQQAANAEDVADKLTKMRNQPGDAPSSQALKEAIEKFNQDNAPFDKESKEQLQRTQQDLDLLKKADDLLANAERLRSVAMKQRDLADRLAQFRDRPNLTGEDRQRADRLAKEQELLQQELEEATQALEKSAEAAKKDLPKMAGDAQKVVDELKKMKVPGDQNVAAREARKGAGEKAREASESAAKKLESLMSKLCNCDSAGEETAGAMDGPLKLPKPGMQKSLKQLSQGRRMPGLPQQGEGQGQMQAGQGMTGSRSRTVIMGPHQPSQGDSETEQAARMQSNGRGRGPGQGIDANGQASPENLSVSGDRQRAASGQNMRGVPVGYRDQAEAYFKRLAEEK